MSMKDIHAKAKSMRHAKLRSYGAKGDLPDRAGDIKAACGGKMKRAFGGRVHKAVGGPLDDDAAPMDGAPSKPNLAKKSRSGNTVININIAKPEATHPGAPPMPPPSPPMGAAPPMPPPPMPGGGMPPPPMGGMPPPGMMPPGARPPGMPMYANGGRIHKAAGGAGMWGGAGAGAPPAAPAQAPVTAAPPPQAPVQQPMGNPQAMQQLMQRYQMMRAPGAGFGARPPMQMPASGAPMALPQGTGLPPQTGPGPTVYNTPRGPSMAVGAPGQVNLPGYGPAAYGLGAATGGRIQKAWGGPSIGGPKTVRALPPAVAAKIPPKPSLGPGAASPMGAPAMPHGLAGPGAAPSGMAHRIPMSVMRAKGGRVRHDGFDNPGKNGTYSEVHGTMPTTVEKADGGHVELDAGSVSGEGRLEKRDWERKHRK